MAALWLASGVVSTLWVLVEFTWRAGRFSLGLLFIGVLMAWGTYLQRRWHFTTANRLDQLERSLRAERCRHSYATGFIEGITSGAQQDGAGATIRAIR